MAKDTECPGCGKVHPEAEVMANATMDLLLDVAERARHETPEVSIVALSVITIGLTRDFVKQFGMARFKELNELIVDLSDKVDDLASLRGK